MTVSQSEGVVQIITYECSICGTEKPQEYQVKDHIDGKSDEAHADITPKEQIQENHEPVIEKDLEALYNINKHAKKYARLADENYRKRKRATAKQNSLKKGALYDLKSSILSRLAGHADSVCIHNIDGEQYYCLYFGRWSFHTPTDHLSISAGQVTGEETIKDFKTNSEKEHSDMSLKESLLHLKERFGESANEYLEEERVSYGRRNYFVGWSYLDS